MDMKLELVPVPVSDVGRAKAFYVDQVGFNADHDAQPNDQMRVCARFADPDGNSWLLQEIPAKFQKV